MIIDNNRKIKLLSGIVVVLILLAVCIGYDSADNNTVSNNATKVKINYTKYNGTYYVDLHNNSMIVPNKTDKVYVEDKTKKKEVKKENPIITMTGKPSCGCRYGYYWYTRTYLNYCPNCHHWNCLGNKHKWGARYEQEISCFRCDSDFCICCGKEKYSWSRVYLRKA